MDFDKLIRDFKYLRDLTDEIQELLVRVDCSLESDCVSEELAGKLNFAICMVYEEGILFLKRICQRYSVEWLNNKNLF